MTEIMELRNALMAELNAGYFDRDSWGALVIMARDANCMAIAEQAERYISHYQVEVTA